MGESSDGREPHSSRDPLEAALAESCEALLGLQLIRAVGDVAVKAHANRAIDSLRRAIVELRAARGEHQSALAQGFVTGERPEGTRAPP